MSSGLGHGKLRKIVRFGFRNLWFRNRGVSKMLGDAYGLSKKLLVDFLCDIYKIWKFWTKTRFFRGQLWPDLRSGRANVCYYYKLNNMLMCEIM